MTTSPVQPEPSFLSSTLPIKSDPATSSNSVCSGEKEEPWKHGLSTWPRCLNCSFSSFSSFKEIESTLLTFLRSHTISSTSSSSSQVEPSSTSPSLSSTFFSLNALTQVTAWIAEQAKSTWIRTHFSTDFFICLVQVYFQQWMYLSKLTRYQGLRAMANLLADHEPNRQALLLEFQQCPTLLTTLINRIPTNSIQPQNLHNHTDPNELKVLFVFLLNFSMDFDLGRLFLIQHDCILFFIKWMPKLSLPLLKLGFHFFLNLFQPSNPDHFTEAFDQLNTWLPDFMSALVHIVQLYPKDLDVLFSVSQLCFTLVASKSFLLSMASSPLLSLIFQMIQSIYSTSFSSNAQASVLDSNVGQNQSEQVNSSEEDKLSSSEEVSSILSNFTHVLIAMSQIDDISDQWISDSFVFTSFVNLLTLFSVQPLPSFYQSNQCVGVCACICLANLTRSDLHVGKAMLSNTLKETLFTLLFTASVQLSAEFQIAISALLRHLALPFTFREKLGQSAFNLTFFNFLKSPLSDFVLNLLIFIRYCCSEESNLNRVALDQGPSALESIFSCIDRFQETPSIVCEVGRIFSALICTACLHKSDDALNAIYQLNYLQSIWTLLQSPYHSVYPEAFHALSSLIANATTTTTTTTISSTSPSASIIDERRKTFNSSWPSCWSTWLKRLWSLPDLDPLLLVHFLICVLEEFPNLKPSIQLAVQSLDSVLQTSQPKKDAVSLLSQILQ